MALNLEETFDQGPLPRSSNPGNEVVISGISGLFPKSENVQEFMENLFNKVDMVSSENDRWAFDNNEIPKHFGFVKDMEKFDNQFFKVHYKQARNFDCMGRKLLESTYGAIFDSGTNPMNLRGKKVGVFIGTTSSETEKTIVYNSLLEKSGFAISGLCRTMYANRISYWLDVKGPSYALDLSCSSALMCLEHAYKSIKAGYCEAAIVGASNYCMHPYITLNYKRAGLLCMDGKTKSFDKNGDGYVRSDSINVLFLQKAKDAKRIYAEVHLASGNYSLSLEDKFTPFRDVKFLTNFFNELYSDNDVSPDDIEFIEGYAAGMGQADLNELEAIGKVFGKKKSIKVGSIKSNMGHSEAASGANSIIKLCIAYHKGKIPANLHYYNSADHISEVRDGKVQVLQEHLPFNRGYTAINSFSLNGYNMHIVLKGRYKKKDPERYLTNIPFLIALSGRKEDCVSKMINQLKSQIIDAEQIALLHDIHETNIQGHLCRGYAILEKSESETKCLAENVDYYQAVTRPVWFLYSGMGSQWAGMGTDLMRIPTFASAIQKCHKVLQPKGIDIVKILTDKDKTIYDNILHSFVGIAAVQIGLTDVLREMGIIPDNIIGHSVGELGCAYADGCFTAEEMILSAYSRGLVSVQTQFIKGSMAAVGLGYSDILHLCPPEIEIACHNSSQSSTISGPADNMKQFVSELTSRKIFAKEVPCSNIAYHSRYIAEAGPGLLKYLKEVIVDPKPRTKKWLSTSIPQDKWDDSLAKHSSPQYHTNNLLNPVLFEETSKLIPSNAIVIEIAPHGLLQAIVKRSHSECSHVPLTRRGHEDPVKYFLEAIGKLYTIGLSPKLQVLYPKVEFPVSTETPLLSHLIGFEHSDNWPQSTYNSKQKIGVMEREYIMSIHDDDYKYLGNHIRDGKCVFPEAGLLVLVWETFAMSKELDFTTLSVDFSDIKFSNELIIHVEIPLKLLIMINKGNNMFEISFENTTIVNGYIKEREELSESFEHQDFNENNEEFLNSEEVYKMLYNKGYSYKDQFQSIQSINAYLDKAFIKWDDEWTTYLDGLIQLNVISRTHHGISVPKLIKSLTISIPGHSSLQLNNGKDSFYNVNIDHLHKVTRSGGVIIDNIVFVDNPKVIEKPDAMQTKIFVPHSISSSFSEENGIQIILQIVHENIKNNVVKVAELRDKANRDMSSVIKQIAYDIPSIDVDVFTIDIENSNLPTNKPLISSNLLIFHSYTQFDKIINNLYTIITQETFIMILNNNRTVLQKNTLFTVISEISVSKQNNYILLMKKTQYLDKSVIYIPIVDDHNFEWLPRVQDELKKSKRVVLVSENQKYCGVLGFVDAMLKFYPEKLSVIIVDDNNVEFNCENKFFGEQLQKNLKINVLRKLNWGGYYYLPSEISAESNNLKLISLVPGDFESLTWVENQSMESYPNPVQVCYTAISQKDVQRASDDDILEQNFGMDFSGIDIAGQKVMGIVEAGATATIVQVDPDFVWPIPDYWTLEDAATVPVPYLLAYYCLGIQNKLQRKSSVFVTGGAGALGQAVISICLALDCKVYTTVSDNFKKIFLLKIFPQLDEKNIGCSHDDAIHKMVITNSDNICCDVVINCASGRVRESAMKCTSSCGYFFDLNNYDIKQNKEFGMNYMTNAKNYTSIQLSSLYKNKNKSEKKMLHYLIAEGIAKGFVKPLSRLVYSPSNVSKAFRMISCSRNRGRILINMKDPMVFNRNLKVIPKMWCTNIGTYIIVCDCDEIAIQLVEQLTRNGAKNFILHIKSDFVSGYMRTKLKSWKRFEVNVKISYEILQTEKGSINLLTEASKLGPVHGIFIILELEEDECKNRMNQKLFANKFEKTALVVRNLDIASQNICSELNYFAVLTRLSKSCADSYNNSVVEKICQNRNEIGLPALFLTIASLKQYGHESQNLPSRFLPQSATAVLKALEINLKLKQSNVISYKVKKQVDPGFFQKIAKILGINNIDEVDGNLKISDFIVSDLNFMEIKSIIKHFYKTDYPPDKIVKLSFSDLRQLHQKDLRQSTKFDSGLGAFFTYIDEDECLSSEPMITMATKANISAEKSEIDIDFNEAYMLVIPGFEGHHQRFESICKSLKVEARILQLGPDLSTESIPNMASEIMKSIQSKFDFKSKFYLMGYSFGVDVALELAVLFEKQGVTGIVYCLDSSPDALRSQIDAYLGNLNKTQLQNTIVEHMFRLMSGKMSDRLINDLQHAKSWPEKIQACVNRLNGIAKYSNQYKRSIIDSLYKRMMLARYYEPNISLKSQIVLIKGIPHPNQDKQLSHDYNLSRYTNLPLQVFNIESDHALASEDCRVANILNKFIEPQVLQKFKKKNLCESYQAINFKTIH